MKISILNKYTDKSVLRHYISQIKLFLYDTFNKLLDAAKSSNIPSTKNQRIFEVAKELVVRGSHVSAAVSIAKELVDKVGIEYK